MAYVGHLPRIVLRTAPSFAETVQAELEVELGEDVPPVVSHQHWNVLRISRQVRIAIARVLGWDFVRFVELLPLWNILMEQTHSLKGVR